MPQKRIQTTLLDRLEFMGLEGFYFWQKPKVAKTLNKDSHFVRIYFVWIASGKALAMTVIAL